MTAQSKTFVESSEARWRAIGRRGWAKEVVVLWAKANSEGGQKGIKRATDGFTFSYLKAEYEQTKIFSLRAQINGG